MAKSKEAHITIDGKPLCVEHDYLMFTLTASGEFVTCGYRDVKDAEEVARYLEQHFASLLVVPGCCPEQTKYDVFRHDRASEHVDRVRSVRDARFK